MGYAIWNAVTGAAKFYFAHYSRVVIILIITGLCKPAFSIDSFGKVVFCLPSLIMFSARSVLSLM